MIEPELWPEVEQFIFIFNSGVSPTWPSLSRPTISAGCDESFNSRWLVLVTNAGMESILILLG